MVEKLVVHEIMVRLQVRWGQSQILVHVEGHDVLETNTALLVGFDQFGINAFRGSGWKAKNKCSGSGIDFAMI